MKIHAIKEGNKYIIHKGKPSENQLYCLYSYGKIEPHTVGYFMNFNEKESAFHPLDQN